MLLDLAGKAEAAGADGADGFSKSIKAPEVTKADVLKKVNTTGAFSGATTPAQSDTVGDTQATTIGSADTVVKLPVAKKEDDDEVQSTQNTGDVPAVD